MRPIAILGSLIVAFAFACSGSSTTSPDAKVYLDNGRSPGCTGHRSHRGSGTGLMCKTFTGAGYSVCTQNCGTCPAGGTCNNMGICKPTAPNSCTPP